MNGAQLSRMPCTGPLVLALRVQHLATSLEKTSSIAAL